MSILYFEDIARQYPGTNFDKTSRKYRERLEWIKKDFISNPMFPGKEMADFKSDIAGDIMFHEAISAKCVGMTDAQKVAIEAVADHINAGESMTLELQGV